MSMKHPLTLSLKRLSNRTVEHKSVIFVSFYYSFNSEQTDNSEYEQYLTENDRNYETYCQNSVDEEEESNFVHADLTYGRDAVQESFFCMFGMF